MEKNWGDTPSATLRSYKQNNVSYNIILVKLRECLTLWRMFSKATLISYL